MWFNRKKKKVDPIVWSGVEYKIQKLGQLEEYRVLRRYSNTIGKKSWWIAAGVDDLHSASAASVEMSCLLEHDEEFLRRANQTWVDLG